MKVHDKIVKIIRILAPEHDTLSSLIAQILYVTLAAQPIKQQTGSSLRAP